MRIAIVIREGRGSDKDMPAKLGDILSEDILASVSGNFEVCPVPPGSPPDDKFACIETMTQITVVYGKNWKPSR